MRSIAASHARPYAAGIGALFKKIVQRVFAFVQIVTDSATVFLPLDELVDTEKEKARLSAETERLKGEIARAEAKLANPGFTSKAPEKVVENERGKLRRLKETYAASLDALSKL